jgi:hypothetical protein
MINNVKRGPLDLNNTGNSVKSDDNKNSYKLPIETTTDTALIKNNNQLTTNTDIALIRNNNQSSIVLKKENMIEKTTPKYIVIDGEVTTLGDPGYIVKEYTVRFDSTGEYDNSLNWKRIMCLGVAAALLALPVYVSVCAGIVAGMTAAMPMVLMAGFAAWLSKGAGDQKWYEHTDFSGLSARDLRKLIEKIVKRQYGQVKDVKNLVIESIEPKGPDGKWDHIYSVKVRFKDEPDS